MKTLLEQIGYQARCLIWRARYGFWLVWFRGDWRKAILRTDSRLIERIKARTVNKSSFRL